MTFLHKWMTDRKFRNTLGACLEWNREIRNGIGVILASAGVQINVPCDVMEGDAAGLDRFVIDAVFRARSGQASLDCFMRERGYTWDGRPLDQGPMPFVIFERDAETAKREAV